MNSTKNTGSGIMTDLPRAAEAPMHNFCGRQLRRDGWRCTLPKGHDTLIPCNALTPWASDETVITSLRDPGQTAHRASERCEQEAPHSIAECGEFAAPLGESRAGEPTCQLAGPGRGDCLHFVGLPVTLDETTTDHYGKPHGWCWWCWQSHRLAIATQVVEAAEAFCAELQEDAEGVPQPELQKLHAALDASDNARLTDERAAATTGEPVAYKVVRRNERGSVIYSLTGSLETATQWVAEHQADGETAELVPLYAAPSPQVAALTEERDAREQDFTRVVQEYDAKVASLSAALGEAKARLKLVDNVCHSHHAASLVTWEDVCPVCAEAGGVEFYAENARIYRALPAGDAPR